MRGASVARDNLPHHLAGLLAVGFDRGQVLARADADLAGVLQDVAQERVHLAAVFCGSR